MVHCNGFPGYLVCVYLQTSKVHCNIFSGLTYNMNLMYDMHFALFEKFIEKVFCFSSDLGGGRGGGEIRSTVKSGISQQGRFEKHFDTQTSTV